MHILYTSKWFNAATIASTDTALLDTIHHLSFVKKSVYENFASSTFKSTRNKFQIPDEGDSIQINNYGSSYAQIELMNLQSLHGKGYLGNNIHIAVFDAGYENADTLPFFQTLWQNNQILGTRDFVDPSSDIFREYEHGMLVLQLMAAKDTGRIIGTSPKASFWLIRTEDAYSEYRIEEDNWIAAAEFADSAGVDIINSSLGYHNVFTDQVQNHSYEEMDGNTTRITKAADIAASKGILIVNSAGNERNTGWFFISAPADGDSVLSVGATDKYGYVTYFSSSGPSSDGRIKPNVCAMGIEILLHKPDGTYKLGKGTSYSSPILAGAAACLWEAFAYLTAWELKTVIEQSSHRYFNPDYDYGYGIPDFNYAYNMLSQRKNKSGKSPGIQLIYPNPVEDVLYVDIYSENSARYVIYIFDLMGHLVQHKQQILLVPGNNLIKVSIPPTLSQGMYYIALWNKHAVSAKHFIKK